MQFTAAYTNLETMVPTIVTDPALINPGQRPPDAFTDEPWAGGTTVNVEGSAYSAGLSKRQVPLPAGVSRFVLSYEIRPSQDAALFSQAHECDLMIVDAAGNRFNASAQKNNAEGGMWQIANAAGGWVDTGFQPGPFPPDEWTPVAIAFQVDWSTKTLSVLSITNGTAGAKIPDALKGMPATPKSGWAPSIIVLQIQDCLNAKGGAYTRDMRNIAISMQ